MRFASFRLVRYGHFDDCKMLFPGPCPGQADLHLVFGLNEAGKSTMQAGLVDFLFGRDDKNVSHQFRYAQGGVLEAEVEVGDQNFVLQRRMDASPRGSRKKDERFTDSTLIKMTAGLTRDDYQRELAFDHRRLQISGGEFLEFDLFSTKARDKPKSGLAAAERRWSSFFDQETGIRRYAIRQGKLQEKAEQHLKLSNGKILKMATSGNKPTSYWDAEQEYDKAQKDLKQLRRKRGEYLSQYQDACQRHNQAVAEVQRCEQEQEWLDRLVRTAAWLARAAQLEAECGSAQGTRQLVRFPPDAMEAVTRASQQLLVREEIIHEAKLHSQGHEQQVILALAEQIEQLAAKAAKCADFPEQIAKRQQDISRIQERVNEHTRSLGWDADQVKQFLPTRSQRELLLEVMDNHKNLEPLRAQIARLRAEHPWLASASGADGNGIRFAFEQEQSECYQLRQVLERVRLLGDIQAKMSEVQDAVDQAERDWQASFEALHPWSGTGEELHRMNPPAQAIKLVEYLSETRSKMEAGETDLAKLRNQLELLRARQQKLPRVLDSLTFASLQQARRRRQNIWAELKQGWDPGRIADYEALVILADDLADQRFAAAETVSQADRLESEIEQLQEREQLDEQALAVVREQFREQNALWSTLMISLGLAGLSVDNYQDWLERRNKAKGERQRGNRARQDYRAFVECVERLRQEMLSELVGVGQICVPRQQLLVQSEQLDLFQRDAPSRRQQSDLRCGDLSQLVVLADEYLADQLHKSGRREQLRRDYHQATKDLQEQEQVYQGWQDKWLQAVAGCSLPADIDLRSARAGVDCMKDLESDLERIEDITVKRIGTMQRDLAALELAAGELTDGIAIDIPQVMLKKASVFETVRLLMDLLEKARREDLIRRDREQRRAESEQKQVETLSELEPLFCLAGIDVGLDDSLGELGRVIRRSQQLEELDRCRQAITDVLNPARDSDQGCCLAEIRQALATQPLEDYQQRHNQVKQQLSESIVKRESASEQVEKERKQLEDIENQIAQIESRCENFLAKMERNVHSYLGLTLRASLLRRAVECHRRERQDELMGRVDHYLQAMTGNSLGTLEIGGNPQLVLPQAVRATGGEVVKFQGLSEGTRDQLFLALCLSESEWRLKRYQLPLLADSLFVNFDDERTIGGFRALRELGLRTQVIYFTHHRHLVDLVQDALEEDLNVVELETQSL